MTASSKRRLVLLSVSVLLVIVAIGALFRISKPRDILAYIGMASECHPVWKEFALRRFGAGDSMVDLLKRYPANRVEKFDRYGTYEFYQNPAGIVPFTGLTVTARDGKLLSAEAWSCTWQFSFFSTKDPELTRQHQIFANERHAKFERRRLDELRNELEKFFSARNRWPTNEQEFSRFVYDSPSDGTNGLGVVLVEQNDGMMNISLVEFPEEKRSVAATKGKN